MPPKSRQARRGTTRRQARDEEPAVVAPTLSTSKKLIFSVIITAGFFVLLELSLAAAGIKPILYQYDPYVGFAANVPLFVEEPQSDGFSLMVTAPNKVRWFNRQRFPREKADGTYRVFAVGGSTTYGRPYDDRGSFSGWLREFLATADPTRNWEVINAGGISYASYRVSMLMEELIDYEPDLFIIYTGHNEFLERRTYGTMAEAPRAVTAVGGLVSRTRVYAAGSRILGSAAKPPDGTSGSRSLLQGEVDTILAHSVGPRDYTRDQELQAQVIEHFRFNLSRMIDIAHAGGADVLLVGPAANLKDCSPFKSEFSEGLSQESADELAALLVQASESGAGGRFQNALVLLEKAIAIDPHYAELQYRHGLVLYELGRYDDAKNSLIRALDEDICPLRALTSIRRTVNSVAADRGVPLVDFAKIVAERSEHGITGSDYFLDHVHLNLDGYRMLALELIDAFAQENILSLSSGWNEAAVKAVTLEIEGRIDQEAQGVALRNLAKVFDWAGKQEEAARIAGQAAELLGDDAETHNVLGRAAASRGKLDQAIAHFRQALELKPDFVEPHTPLGIALGQQGQLDEAVHHFRQAIEGKPDFSEAYYNLGFTLATQGKLDEAIRYYRQAIDIDPGYAPAYNNLGTAFRLQGKLDEATAAFRRSLEIRADYPEARMNLGVLLRAQGKTEMAMEQFDEVLRRNPRYAAGHNNRGTALMSLGQIEEAVKAFRQAAELDSGDPEAQYNLGTALMSLAEHEEAVLHFRRAAELAPRHAKTHGNLGTTLMALGRYDEAIRSYRRALQLEPEEDDSHYNLAIALMMRERTEEAIHHYRQALRINPGHAEAHSNLGNALLSHNAHSEAVTHYTKALRLRPTYFDAHFNIGIALGAMRRYSEAVEHFRQAVELRPDHADSHYYLGSALEKLGYHDEAQRHLAEASRREPTGRNQ